MNPRLYCHEDFVFEEDKNNSLMSSSVVGINICTGGTPLNVGNLEFLYSPLIFKSFKQITLLRFDKEQGSTVGKKVQN